MRTIINIVLVVLLLVFQTGGPLMAQYDTDNYAYYYGRGPYQPQTYSREPPGPRMPFHYRLAPKPGTYGKWNQYNRFSDYQNSLRSPLNRESDLDYLLRTF